jgi:outer membrane protein TolC
LDSQRQLQRAALGHAQVQGQLYLDAVELMVATGGSGWSNPPRERTASSAASLGR